MQVLGSRLPWGALEAHVDRPEPRSNVSEGVQWASRATTLGLEFALPPLLGVALDRWWGIAPWATVIGV